MRSQWVDGGGDKQRFINHQCIIFCNRFQEKCFEMCFFANFYIFLPFSDSETTAYGLYSFSLKGQSAHRVTSGSRRRLKHIRVWHIHHLAKGWRCSSPSLRWLARPQYGLLLFSRWLTAKTRNYVKVNTTGIMKELQSRCGDAIGRLFKTRTHTRTHTQAHTTLDEKLRPGVLPIRLLFSSLCSSSAGLIL